MAALVLPFIWKRPLLPGLHATTGAVGHLEKSRAAPVYLHVERRIKSRTRQQVSCFGPDGLLRRHDFAIDILGGVPSSLYATGYRDVDGIIVPSTRRAYAQEGDNQPVMVAIDIGKITIR
jgi:hypothetical protein